MLLQHGRHVTATIEVIAWSLGSGEAVHGGRSRGLRGNWPIAYRRDILIEFPCGLQQYVPLCFGEHGRVAQVACRDLVAGGRGTQEEPAFAAGLDQRDDRIVVLALGEFQVAADLGLASVDHMPAVGLRGLDDEPVAQVDWNAFPPR